MSHDPSPSEPTNDLPSAEIQAPEVEASEASSEMTEQAEGFEIGIDAIEVDSTSDEVVIVEVTGDLDVTEAISEDDFANADADRPLDEVVIVDFSQDLSINAEATGGDRGLEASDEVVLTDAQATDADLPDVDRHPDLTHAEMTEAAVPEAESDLNVTAPDPTEPKEVTDADLSDTDVPDTDVSDAATADTELAEADSDLERTDDVPLPSAPPTAGPPRSATSKRPSASPRPSPRSATTDETVPQTIVRLLRQQVWPLLKTLLVVVLRLAVRGLEALINQLEPTPQPSASGQIASPSSRSGDVPHPEGMVSPGRQRGTLTAAIVGMAIVAIVLLPGFFSKPPAPISDVAIVPAPTPISEVPDEVIITPDVPEPEPSPIATTPEMPEMPEVAEPAGPDDLSHAETPIALEPTPEPSPELPPPPPVELTPQQRLLATIKDDLDSLSNAYSQSLIQAIKVNFRLSRLTVVMSQDWYSLPPEQQSTLANELLERSQQLDFSRLEITDARSVLLARNPVVGIEMIILRRSASTATA